MNILKVPATLDPGFLPLSVAMRDYRDDVRSSGKSQRFVCAIERGGGFTSPWETEIFPEGVQTQRTVALLERIVKGLLWMRGGYKIKVSGSKALFEHLKDIYRPGGARAFDEDYMAGVFEHPFEIVYYDNADEIAKAVEGASEIGRHLDGCRAVRSIPRRRHVRPHLHPNPHGGRPQKHRLDRRTGRQTALA